MTTDSRLRQIVREEVSSVLRSDDFKAWYKQMSYETASALVLSRFTSLNLGPGQDEVQEFRDNMQFIASTRRRCDKIWDKTWSTSVGIVVAGIVGGGYLLLKHFFPNLPGSGG